MKCEGCKYFYLGDYYESRNFYNALTDSYEQHSVKLINKPCCGLNAGGKALDKKQPRCCSFEEKVNDG